MVKKDAHNHSVPPRGITAGVGDQGFAEALTARQKKDAQTEALFARVLPARLSYKLVQYAGLILIAEADTPVTIQTTPLFGPVGHAEQHHTPAPETHPAVQYRIAEPSTLVGIIPQSVTSQAVPPGSHSLKAAPTQHPVDHPRTAPANSLAGIVKWCVTLRTVPILTSTGWPHQPPVKGSKKFFTWCLFPGGADSFRNRL